MRNKRYISFSLWGKDPIYSIGAIKNAEQYKLIYEGWEMIVYYNNTVSPAIIRKLESMGIKCIDVTTMGIYGMFWRFLAADLEDCEYAIFRDTDSRVSVREKLAVEEWISSGKTLHVMRDHPYHSVPAGNFELGMLGGMWGIKGGVVNLTKLILKYPNVSRNNYGDDQNFLRVIYQMFQEDRTTHDDFFEKKPFPIERVNGRFVGERMNINDEPLTDDYKLVL